MTGLGQPGARAWALAAAIVIGAATGGGAGDREAPPSQVVAAAKVRAEHAATALTADLFTELSRATAQLPPERAVTACGDIAQRLTDEISRREGISVRRTSLRIRNRENVPDAFEREVLERWAEPGTRPVPSARVVPREQGGFELRYLRPIIVQPQCVACHGAADRMAEPLRAAIRERYPDDRATGFRAGDVRGAVSVRVPLAGPTP
jgi:hypothetical protein